jgi:nucleoside-diphosphate-sugar epimerase
VSGAKILGCAFFLGGTRFLGRAITDAALGRGNTVTLFNRGVSDPGLYPGVETITGDRTSGLSALDGRVWEAVIDVAGYDPRVVELSARALAGRTGRYVFVSTVSVYADQNTTEAQLEDAPVARLRPGATSLEETYGPNKAMCEQVVRDVYGGRALIGRPGLITGPHDPTDRVPYWPRRIARGGRVLAPATRLQRRRAGLDPHRAAGRGGRRPGDGHPAVGRRAGLRRVQRRR